MALGFPSGKDMSAMFGYVTDEDREGWAKDRQERAGKPTGTAREMTEKSTAPAMDMAKRSVQAQMHGAQNEAQRGSQPKQHSRIVTRETVTEQSRNIDGAPDQDYGPEF